MSIVGIDLGTTYSTVAAVDDRGRPITIPNRDGEILTPSAIYFASDSQVVVGQPALDVASEHPDRVATLIKRRMGYPNYGTVAGRMFRSETLSAIVLKKLVNDAAMQLGVIKRAVITVPAYFDDTRRKATIDAGKIAGLDVVDILDEPSAAALAYTVQHGNEIPDNAPKTVLVYDLGGGTFDVTLVQLSRKRFRVLGIEGDVRLGGKDWDDRLIDHASAQFQAQYGSDPKFDPQSMAMLHAAAERAKRTLSKVDQATMTVVHEGRKLAVAITRSEFEAMTRDLLIRTRLTAQQVVTQAGRTWSQVDKVLMVGGSTHMPMTGRMLAELTGKEPDRSLAVSEVVARGAAVHADIFEQKMAIVPRDVNAADVVEISVNAHSLGVEARQEGDLINSKLILKNTQLPAGADRVFYTSKENQSRVRVRILQGEANQSEACIPVGECWIQGLAGNLPKGSPIRVRCGVAANGLIEVTAIDMTNGTTAKAEIKRTSGLDNVHIEQEAAYVRGLEIL
ncbi:molecular chaperone DnaK [soil metagenome]